jgi:predicted AlkP superfamily phosphohydrolase/phosphomutase
MRFLRMFTNALLAGALSAAYLTVLVLQLNPHVPLLSATTWRWFLTLGLTYGLHIAVAFYVLIVVREFFSMSGMSPGWASVRVLAWLSALGAAVAAVLTWLNVDAFRTALGDIAARRMMAGAVATGVAALALFATAVAHYSYGRRGSRVGAALFALAAVASITLPLAARGPAIARPEPARWPGPDTERHDLVPGRPRVTLLLLDGASLEYLRTRATEGRLPNFSTLLESGASMYLATIRPTQPGPVWAAAATGMYPSKNGVRSAAQYVAPGDRRPIDLLPDRCFSHALVRLGIVEAQPDSSAAWRARPLWSILSNAGVPVGIVRWPLTYPAPPVLGYLLSERFHDASGPASQFDEQAAYPSAVLAQARASLAAAEGGNGGADRTDVPEAPAAARDRAYARAFRDLQSASPAQVAALRLQAVDVAGHHLYDESQPSAFRAGTEASRLERAQRLERAYAGVDTEIGYLIGALAPGDLLLVMSGFGMERIDPAKELLARALGDPPVRGTHERAPDGFLIAYGTDVRPGRLPRGSIVDLTPTVLYFLGLPVGRDMDGFARTDLFKTDFTAERPIAFIGSHNR